jgi:molybdopterin/thiamine biosynthesis adenylyltransferase
MSVLLRPHLAVSDTADSQRRPWYEVDSERVAYELGQFKEAGLPVAYRIGMSNGWHAGLYVVQTSLPFKGKDIPVEVVYPFDFPDSAPTVYGPGGLLDRHQTRTAGNFCLLEDPDSDWWPGWSGAQLVAVKLRGLLQDTEAGKEVVAAGEADMPEPITGHLTYKGGWATLVPDPFWTYELAAGSGEMTLAEGVFAAQLMLTRAEGIGTADETLVKRVTHRKSKEHRGVWVALPDTVPSSPSFNELLDLAEQAFPDVLQRLKRALSSKPKLKTAEGWVGLTFIEEGPQRAQFRRAWAFAKVVLRRDDERSINHLVRAYALTPSERARRLPELQGLDQARIVIVGAGSLGGPVALEMAKGGVGHLDIVDYDYFDANNVVRHVLGVKWAGTKKTIALSIEAEDRNPFGEVGIHPVHVGGDQDDSDALDALIRKAGLVVDTTGSQAVARILDRRCREMDKRLVIAGLTAGSFGGEVVALRPNGPCFMCFALAQQDGTIPSPEAGPRSNVTPIGCSHPAFSGAGFDATELAAITARIVVQATHMTHYPSLEYDWVVVNFRGAPRWQSGILKSHPACPRCSAS